MVYGKKITVLSDNHTKHTNRLRTERRILCVKPGGTRCGNREKEQPTAAHAGRTRAIKWVPGASKYS